MWDAEIPAGCLGCWIAQRNPRQTDIKATAGGLHDEIGGYRIQRGIRRAQQVGRRVVSELMVHDWPDPGRTSSEVVRSIVKDVACLKEIALEQD